VRSSTLPAFGRFDAGLAAPLLLELAVAPPLPAVCAVDFPAVFAVVLAVGFGVVFAGGFAVVFGVALERFSGVAFLLADVERFLDGPQVLMARTKVPRGDMRRRDPHPCDERITQIWCVRSSPSASAEISMSSTVRAP